MFEALTELQSGGSIVAFVVVNDPGQLRDDAGAFVVLESLSNRQALAVEPPSGRVVAGDVR